MLSTVLQSKLLKWWRMARNQQAKSAPAAQDAELAAVNEQAELEKSYNALNVLLTKGKILEEENQKLKEEMNALRQRIDREKTEFMKYAISEFATDMICVADNIRRAIETVPKERLSADPALSILVEGFKVTERSFLSALSRHRVTRFDPLGEPFNPHLHEATATVNAPDLPANTVVQVVHAGFIIGERLLRPAGVVVAQESTNAQPAGPHTADFHAPLALSGATGSVLDTPLAVPFERSSSVLHKPVIEATEGASVATQPISIAANDTNGDIKTIFMNEIEGDHRDYQGVPHDYIYARERDWPSLSEQEAAYKEAEIFLPSDPANIIEAAQKRTKDVNDAFESKNYAEAARLQEKVVAAVRFKETAAEGIPGDGTLDALLSLSWYQLCAGQYDAVIATADQAAAIREDYISIDTNRAHALMLKGSTEEARNIYNLHRGKETRNKKTWDREVLDDFAELEQAISKNPLMDEIRNAWSERADLESC